MHKSFLLTLLFPLQILPGMAQSAIRMVVGTYTDGTSRGIYSFVFDQVKGIAHALDTLNISNPSFLTISQNGSRIYAVSENSDSTAAVNAIRFDSRSGKMQLINSQSTKGADPCYVSTNGRILLTANYSGGSLSIFPLAKDGSVLPMSQQIKGTTTSSDMPQQSTAHIHCAQFSPSGQEVLATDFSANRLIRMTLHQGTALSSPTTAALMPKNSGCRHFVWSNDNKYCYVISELSGAVTVLRNTPGLMPVVQQIQSDSVGGHGSADIHLSHDGRFLYTTNRLVDDGISIFAVDKESGRLNKIGYQPTGIHPRNFNITPNGRFLLCACRDSGVIQVFLIDSASGLLHDIHQDIKIDKPVCIQFF